MGVWIKRIVSASLLNPTRCSYTTPPAGNDTQQIKVPEARLYKCLLCFTTLRCLLLFDKKCMEVGTMTALESGRFSKGNTRNKLFLRHLVKMGSYSTEESHKVNSVSWQHLKYLDIEKQSMINGSRVLCLPHCSDYCIEDGVFLYHLLHFGDFS